MPEWIRTSKAQLVFRYEISDLFKILLLLPLTVADLDCGNKSNRFGLFVYGSIVKLSVQLQCILALYTFIFYSYRNDMILSSVLVPM